MDSSQIKAAIKIMISLFAKTISASLPQNWQLLGVLELAKLLVTYVANVIDYMCGLYLNI